MGGWGGGLPASDSFTRASGRAGVVPVFFRRSRECDLSYSQLGTQAALVRETVTVGPSLSAQIEPSL